MDDTMEKNLYVVLKLWYKHVQLPGDEQSRKLLYRNVLHNNMQLDTPNTFFPELLKFH